MEGENSGLEMCDFGIKEGTAHNAQPNEEMDDETRTLTLFEATPTLLGVQAIVPTPTTTLESDTIASSSFALAFSLNQ